MQSQSISSFLVCFKIQLETKDKKDIENYIMSNPKIEKYEWINIENIESALVMHIKQ